MADTTADAPPTADEVGDVPRALGLFPGIDLADLWHSGSAWSRSNIFGEPLPYADQCNARRAHSATLARHGVCPLCYTRQPRWRDVCAACDKRLVRLQVPKDMAHHGLVPLTGNRIPRAEVKALQQPPPLWRGEYHVAPPRLPMTVSVPVADMQD